MTRRERRAESADRSAVRHVGLDLAWGERARTGVAVTDDAGALVESSTVRTDDEIAAALERHLDRVVTVAVDAPLIVRNPAGRRGCEAEISRVFGRYRAGAHPANTGNPLFRPPRAARLAERFGWRTDPAHRPVVGAPVCIEVYPHPAMVVLFGLDRTIPYKVKQGRDLASLQAAYERLVGHMETDLPELGLGDHPRWRTIRAAVRASERKADLRRIEDEIDAIVCAYLAWLWTARHEALHVYGDPAAGYIVAPPPPRPASNRELPRPGAE